MALTRKLQKTNRGQYTLTVPKQLIDLLDWNTQSVIEFGFDKGKITLQKIKPKKVEKND